MKRLNQRLRKRREFQSINELYQGWEVICEIAVVGAVGGWEGEGEVLSGGAGGL